MPLALKLLKLAIDYDAAACERLRSESTLPMLSQVRLLARIIGHLAKERPKLMYRAALTNDGPCFVANFEQLSLHGKRRSWSLMGARVEHERSRGLAGSPTRRRPLQGNFPALHPFRRRQLSRLSSPSKRAL